ncbi:hypothetical protein G7Y79_00004g015130 [Physcia stellaris]|nr:hypothetical protein G7Y79_00004g015130 [Physcia stellaris]
MTVISTKSQDQNNNINGISNGVNSTGKGSNAASNWSDPGPAAFDLRSDVTTRPTPAMLDSLISLKDGGLGDDVFREDETTNSLEAFIAELTGFPAALLVMSGTMGNQLSIRTHLQGPPHSVVADSRSHIISWEAGGLASLSGALAIPIHPSNKHHLTLADIRKHTVTSTDIHACPTRLICLENTLAGTILPLSDARAMSSWARSQKPPIKMHLDGARLWEAVSAEAAAEDRESLVNGLREYSACFDSVSLCFSKGLGAPIGSIIIGSQSFIDAARHKRKSLGGGLRQAALITAPARVAVEETFLGGKLKASHERAREVARMWTQRGGKLEHATETNMVWLDLEDVGLAEGDDGRGESGKGRRSRSFVEMAVERGVKVMGGRLVVHYQISKEATSRLALLFDDVFAHKPSLSSELTSNGVTQEAEKITAVEVE